MNMTRPVIALLLAACATFNGFAAADPKPRVIRSITAGTVILEDGSSLQLTADTKVEKKGYDLSVKDLRAGWSVIPCNVSGEDGARTVGLMRVVGLPIVQGFAPYSGLRDTLAVGKAELGLLPAVQALEGVDVQQAIETMTSAVLRGTGRFLLTDAASRDEVLNEQDFARSGYAQAEAAPKGGKIAPPHYLVKVAILDFDYATRGGTAGSVAGVKIAKTKARSKLTMEIRLVDNTTGLVTQSATATRYFGADTLQWRWNAAETAEAIVPFSGPGGLKDLEKLASSGISVGADGYAKSPIGELFSLAINQLVEQLLLTMPDRPWESVVVDMRTADSVVIRGGSDVGLGGGMTLTVFRRSPQLTDPDTGEPLGSLSQAIGTVEVTEVLPKLSVARVVSGSDLRRGDACVLQSRTQ